MITTIQELERWLSINSGKVYFTLNTNKDYYLSHYNSETLIYIKKKKKKIGIIDLLDAINMIALLGYIDRKYISQKTKNSQYTIPIALDYVISQGIKIRPSGINPIKMNYLSYLNSSELPIIRRKDNKDLSDFSRSIKGDRDCTDLDNLPFDEVDKFNYDYNDLMRYEHLKEQLVNTDINKLNVKNIRTDEAEFIDLALGLDIKKTSRIIKIPFATNRQFINSEFTNKNSGQLQFGNAAVSIPAHHKRFNIERPLDFKLFKLRPNKQKHVMVENLEKFNRNEFINFLNREKHSDKLCIFIHGFNVSFDEAVLSAAQFGVDVIPDCNIMLYSWPSAGRLFFAYQHDREMATRSSFHFDELLEMIHCTKNFDEIFIIAHSMGTFCLAESLRDNSRPMYMNTSVLLTASDIATETFIERHSKNFIARFNKTHIYASSRDRALRMSKFNNGHSRVGDANPLCIVDKIDTIDVSFCDHNFWSIRHSYHCKHDEIVNDIRKMVVENMRPRERSLLKQRIGDGKNYWLLLKNDYSD